MNPYWHNLFRRLQGDQGEGLPPGPVVRAGAVLASRLYGLGAGLRRSLYARGWLKVKRLPAPVVSVGNLTVGGTGKTPVVACLARLLQDRGKRVAILSRGYGGQSCGVVCISDGRQTYKRPPEVGEEPYWLARTLPGVAVYTGACRYAAGLAAWQEFRPDLFLLDDGFQHFQLHRDLDLVLLDAAAPFGNGYLLPRDRAAAARRSSSAGL
jgi:tetraacyldisaccharide 4'-kinase